MSADERNAITAITSKGHESCPNAFARLIVRCFREIAGRVIQQKLIRTYQWRLQPHSSYLWHMLRPVQLAKSQVPLHPSYTYHELSNFRLSTRGLVLNTLG